MKKPRRSPSATSVPTSAPRPSTPDGHQDAPPGEDETGAGACRESKAFRLAILAATLAGPNHKNPESLLPVAARLLRAAEDIVNAGHPKDDQDKASRVRRPKLWPATFKLFLRYVVNAGSEEKNLHRFRRWVESPPSEQDVVRAEAAGKVRVGPSGEREVIRRDSSEIIADWRKKTVTEAEWDQLAKEYLDWWATEVLRQKSDAGHVKKKSRRLV